MGDGAASALVKDVLGRLNSVDIQEFGLLWGFNEDVLALKDDFDRIKGVLQDAEEKHSKEKAVGLWLKSLRSASLEVENVLDEISTEALLQRLDKERGIIYSLHLKPETRLANYGKLANYGFNSKLNEIMVSMNLFCLLCLFI
uniref:Disease resistance N-terminal domain-containing protein n=1 Tax=Helianthus annuus TaxID=4232 RepID=A0A251VUJ9_HELAN